MPQQPRSQTLLAAAELGQSTPVQALLLRRAQPALPYQADAAQRPCFLLATRVHNHAHSRQSDELFSSDNLTLQR
jgi:hypothetical protein